MADDGGAEGLGKGLDALLQGVALVGEGEIGALRAGGGGDAPGDRAVVRHPHDEAALARKNAGPRRIRHESPCKCKETGLLYPRRGRGERESPWLPPPAVRQASAAVAVRGRAGSRSDGSF